VAVVAPSTWLEAFGLVVVEAMAAGVPAVAPAHGAFTELVDHGVTGLLHQPHDPASLADCLRRIRSERNHSMGTAARHRYERDFTPAAGLDRLLSGYESAIREGRSGAAQRNP
jgi:glycosyltransferase involved in cell wall biosynthesis